MAAGLTLISCRDNKNFKPRDNKQGNGGKKIDLAHLRKDGGKKEGGHRERRNSNDGGDKKHFKKRDHGDKKKSGDKKKHEKKPDQSKEELDREMENYWLKAGHKEIGKLP